jgi:murein DD-endopeptidase MepM/ murein hydrolase activator NlpD
MKNLNEEVFKIKTLMKLNESSSSSNKLFGGSSFTWGGGPSDHGTRKLGNWQSDNAWDIMAPAGTPVYAIDGGQVLKSYFAPYKRVIYGWQITIRGKNNDIFYTHLSEVGPKISVGTNIEKGDLIGIIGKPTASWPTHVHIGINNGTDISKYIDKKGNINNFVSGASSPVFDNSESSNFDLKSLVDKILSLIFNIKI